MGGRDAIPEFSFTALTDGGVVGHVTASPATVAADPVVAVGPIGVLPDHQGTGIGSALMARFSPLLMPRTCRWLVCSARRSTTAASGSVLPGSWA